MNVTDRKQENNKVSWQATYFNALPIMKVYNDDGSYNALNPVRVHT